MYTVLHHPKRRSSNLVRRSKAHKLSLVGLRHLSRVQCMKSASGRTVEGYAAQVRLCSARPGTCIIGDGRPSILKYRRWDRSQGPYFESLTTSLQFVHCYTRETIIPHTRLSVQTDVTTRSRSLLLSSVDFHPIPNKLRPRTFLGRFFPGTLSEARARRKGRLGGPATIE